MNAPAGTVTGGVAVYPVALVYYKLWDNKIQPKIGVVVVS
jgi:hypothetical protein